MAKSLPSPFTRQPLHYILTLPLRRELVQLSGDVFSTPREPRANLDVVFVKASVLGVGSEVLLDETPVTVVLVRSEPV